MRISPTASNFDNPSLNNLARIFSTYMYDDAIGNFIHVRIATTADSNEGYDLF